MNIYWCWCRCSNILCCGHSKTGKTVVSLMPSIPLNYLQAQHIISAQGFMKEKLAMWIYYSLHSQHPDEQNQYIQDYIDGRLGRTHAFLSTCLGSSLILWIIWFILWIEK